VRPVGITARVLRSRLARLGIGTALLFGGLGSALAIGEPEQRARLLFETREAEARFAREGRLYGDAALDAYLQSVMDRLYPERHGEIRVRTYRNGEFNAFAVATGNVYVHTGALLRMHNEAELASVLGHEGGHILADHMYRGTRDAKAARVFGTALSLGMVALVGVDPALGAIASYSTMAGFSRDFEREADRLGVARLAAAGYDPRAAAPVFERMAAEVQERKIKRAPYLFADHPQLEDRARNFREFAAAASGGELGREAFIAATQRVRLEVLDATHERRDGRALIALLEGEGRTAEFPPGGEFLLGEGYRLRAEAGDQERALAQYQRSIEAQPDYAPAWGALGRHYARHGDRQRALECLKRFVTLAPEAREAAFAQQTIDRLDKEPAP
jgi:predicted Zn-dependent protease